MGCHDRGTNFNEFYYDETRDRWGCCFSLDTRFDAPTRELLLEGIVTYSSLPLDKWEIEQGADGRWRATQK